MSRNLAYDLDTRNIAGFSVALACKPESALLMFFILFLLLLCASPFSWAQDARASEYRAKAGFLAAFPNFIDWPESVFPSPNAPLLLCVVGDFSFGTSLAEMTQTTSIHGRRVQVLWAHKEKDLRACQILFVSRSESSRYEKIFKAIEGASVLTVGETPDFLARGGAIDFLFENDRLQFEVGMSAAEDAHLRISSNMLALARHVIVKAQAAKSSRVTQPSFRTLFSTPLPRAESTAWQKGSGYASQ